MGNSIIIIFLFVASIVSYGWSAYLTVDPSSNSNWMKMGIAFLLVNVSSISWILIAHLIKNPDKVYVAGVTFDLLLSFAFLFPPLWYFGKTISCQMWLGVIFIFIGILLIKLH